MSNEATTNKTITVSVDGATDEQGREIQSNLCEMVNKAIEAKIVGLDLKLTDLVKTVENNVTDILTTNISIAITKAYELKLESFYTEAVESVSSKGMMDNIIHELGLKFDQALENGLDNQNIDFYTEYIRYLTNLKDKREKPKSSSEDNESGNLFSSEDKTGDVSSNLSPRSLLPLIPTDFHSSPQRHPSSPQRHPSSHQRHPSSPPNILNSNSGSTDSFVSADSFVSTDSFVSANSEENKPEENKSKDRLRGVSYKLFDPAKPEENKPEENKPEENKSEENKSENNGLDYLLRHTPGVENLTGSGPLVRTQIGNQGGRKTKRNQKKGRRKTKRKKT